MCENYTAFDLIEQPVIIVSEHDDSIVYMNEAAKHTFKDCNITELTNTDTNINYSAFGHPVGDLCFGKYHLQKSFHHFEKDGAKYVCITFADVTFWRALACQYKQLTLIDPLTNVENRRAFDMHLDECLTRFNREKQNFAMLFVDLNDFSVINNKYGHVIGDQVLVAVAEQLKNVFRRSTDRVFRYGGDEFVVIVDIEDNVGELHQLTEKLNHNIAGVDVGEVKISVSVGGVTIHHTPSSGVCSFERVVELADKSMYVVKHKQNKKGFHLYEHKCSFIET